MELRLVFVSTITDTYRLYISPGMGVPWCTCPPDVLGNVQYQLDVHRGASTPLESHSTHLQAGRAL